MGNPDEDALKALRDGFESTDESYKRLCYKILRDYINDKVLETKLLQIKLESNDNLNERKEESYKKIIKIQEQYIEDLKNQ